MTQHGLPSLELIEVPVTELEQKYSVIAELGQGGMSVVYLATSRSLGNVQKLVVLKSIRPELLSNDKVRGMFMDEARLAIRLTHPNIVQTYEVATIDRRPVLVMEYMEGQPLSNVLRKSSEVGGMPLPMKLHILCEALNGLDHAHNLTDYDGRSICLVHRDVSPQNIFITYDGHVKILDFGIAKALDRSANTEFGEIKGKIRYMAPEQMQASADLDRRADVFAMGVMLWEALVGRRLWQDAKDVEVMKIVLTQEIPSPREKEPNIHPQLEAICMRAIQRDPNTRYESCAAMLTDLERAMEELGMRSSERELGKLVQGLFSDMRTSIRRAIDRKLKERDGAPLDLRVDNRGLLIDDLMTPSGRRMDVSFTPSAVGITGTGTGSVIQSKKKRRWPIAIAALLLLGVAVAVAAPRFSDNKPVATPTPPLEPKVTTAAAAAVGVPSPGTAASTLKVTLRATPSSAKLYLDGVELPQNPYVSEVARDGSKHELSADADGFGKKSTPVVFAGEEPLDIALELEKKGKGVKGPIGKPFVVPKPAGKPAASVPAAPAAPNCTYPFYIDEAGIKRMRRECM